jgi:hypothetical protein
VKLNRFWLYAPVIFAAGVAASNWEASYQPSAKMYKFIDEHTPLNQGQREIEITLPRGKRFTSFGGCWPRWITNDNKLVYWTQITCNIEKFDPATDSYKPATYQGSTWVEIKP